MSDGEKKSGGPSDAPDEASSPTEDKSRGNSLQDASDEMVDFMDKDDEPGHAGRGDGG